MSKLGPLSKRQTSDPNGQLFDNKLSVALNWVNYWDRKTQSFQKSTFGIYNLAIVEEAEDARKIAKRRIDEKEKPVKAKRGRHSLGKERRRRKRQYIPKIPNASVNINNCKGNTPAELRREASVITQTRKLPLPIPVNPSPRYIYNIDTFIIYNIPIQSTHDHEWYIL